MMDNKAGKQGSDAKSVFVVHGRNTAARDEVFKFLRSLGLEPLEWSDALKLTGEGAPYIGQVLDHAFEKAQAVLVLMTPDEVAYLWKAYAEGDQDPECAPNFQSRPNVLFEAGMALGCNPERTILVEFGSIRPFSDIAGRHVIHLNETIESRKEIRNRLETAGCDVDTSDDSWKEVGDFTPPSPGNRLPLGRKEPSTEPKVQINANHDDYGEGRGRLRVTNNSPLTIYNFNIEIPDEARPGFYAHLNELPLSKLPPYKTFSCITSRSLGGGSQHFDIQVTGETEDGKTIQENAFVSLL